MSHDYAEEFNRMNPGIIPENVMPFCRFLERRGLRFCVDFGYETAEEKCWEILEREEERRLTLGGKGGVIN